MDTNLPVYRIYIDLEDDETGLEANSGVHDPAHDRLSMAFNKDSKKVKFAKSTLQTEIVSSFNKSMKFNDDDQTVYGVAISADSPIYRHDDDGEYYVVFEKPDISDIIHDYSRKENFNNFSVEHNGKNEDGIYMIMSYQIDTSKGHTHPEQFKDESDGTWILGYKFVNTDVYNKFKDGEIRGFSVEGVFVLDEFGFAKDMKEIELALDELIEALEK